MSPSEPPALDCVGAREALLEAELHELQPDAPGTLGRHLAACPRCRDEALRIVQATGELTARLASPPALDVGAILQAAHEGAEDARHTDRPRRFPLRRRQLLRAGLPLAAAAVLATLLLVGREAGDEPLPGPPATPDPPTAVAIPVAEFTPPPDRNAVVMQTRNPDITVIWLYGEGP